MFNWISLEKILYIILYKSVFEHWSEAEVELAVIEIIFDKQGITHRRFDGRLGYLATIGNEMAIHRFMLFRLLKDINFDQTFYPGDSKFEVRNALFVKIDIS
jgi:hypothetical protein